MNSAKKIIKNNGMSSGEERRKGKIPPCLITETKFS